MKAILPVAGWGTRMRPLTWSVPKYLLGVADKPLIQYAIDEFTAAGATDFTFVVSGNQDTLKDYIVKHSGLTKVRFALQKKMQGNADAILKGALSMGKSESAAVSFGDDVLVAGEKTMRAMMALSKRMQAPVLLLERVPKQLVSRYGIVGVRPLVKGKRSGSYEITELIEKPKLEEAPSNLSIVGRYVLTPDIFNELRKLCANKTNMTSGGEFWLTDALVAYIKKGGKVYGVEFKGTRFDCGSKLGLMKANAYFGLRHKELGRELGAYLRSLTS